MKNKLLILSLFALITLLSLFNGCKKNDSFKRNPNNYKVTDIVPPNVAKEIAEKFNFKEFFASTNRSSDKRQLQTTNFNEKMPNGNNKIKNQLTLKDDFEYPVLYIFNFENNAGFLFVSADYNIQPILGFVEHGEFKKDTVPPTYIEWINRTFENTEIVRKGIYDNSKVAKVAWKDYLKQNNIQPNGISVNKIAPPDPGCQDYSNTTTVGPLLQVTWGQGCSYNELCPSKNCNICWGATNAYTGCVTTSAAQVIRYWQPANQYAYNYASMPNTSGNTEVQRLMKDLGLPQNLNMDYGCNGSSSGADIANALKTNFGLASANNISYGISTYQRVKDNLTNHWPVLLGGCSSRTNKFLGIIYAYSNCHEWVCDGYSSTSYMYCNEDGTSFGGQYFIFPYELGLA